MNVVNKVKDKLVERKFKKLEMEVIRLQGEISKLHEQQENLRTTETATDSVDKECYTAIKKTTKRRSDKKIGHDEEEESSNTIRPNELRKEENKLSTKTRKERDNKIKCKSPTKGKTRLEELCKKQVQPTYSVNDRPMKRSRKRCHFCRKRGHLQKDCLSKHMLRKWLRDEASEMYQNTLQ